MATLRDIKRRITGVKSTQQITRAMKMVAAAKLRKAQEQLFNARPYADSLNKILAHVAAQEGGSNHPLLRVREPKNICYLVITSDRGLCGSFNSNVQKLAQIEVDSHDDDTTVRLVNFGRKGYEFFSRRDYDIADKYINLFNDLQFKHARQVSSFLQRAYLEQEYDRVFVIFNYFKSAGSQVATVEQLLPVNPEIPEFGKYEPVDYLYEPSAAQILDEIIPKNLNIQIWRSLLESNGAEHAARMIAMDAATDSAQEMIDGLTLHYNKARQAAITTQISEIVGGAEALQG